METVRWGILSTAEINDVVIQPIQQSGRSELVAVAKAATGELKPQEALETAAEEWIQTVQKYGIAEQKSQYNIFVQTAKKMGYW